MNIDIEETLSAWIYDSNEELLISWICNSDEEKILTDDLQVSHISHINNNKNNEEKSLIKSTEEEEEGEKVNYLNYNMSNCDVWLNSVNSDSLEGALLKKGKPFQPESNINSRNCMELFERDENIGDLFEPFLSSIDDEDNTIIDSLYCDEIMPTDSPANTLCHEDNIIKETTTADTRKSKKKAKTKQDRKLSFWLNKMKRALKRIFPKKTLVGNAKEQ